MPLKVNLRAGERIIINGALISVNSAIELTFHNHASLMLERQLIRPDDANTPARRIYLAVQNAYVASDNERPGWLEQALAYIDGYGEATVSPPIRAKTDAIRTHLMAGEFYAALRLTRELFSHDDLLLPPSAIPIKTDPEKTGAARSDQGRSDKTVQSKTSQSKTAPGRIGQTRTGQGRTGQTGTLRLKK